MPPLPYLRIALFACLWLATTATRAQSPDPIIVSAQVGFNGSYKLGCWTPIHIELLGGTQAYTGRVIVTAPDTDGVPTRVISQQNRPIGIEPATTQTVDMFVRIGQSSSPLTVQFLSDDGKIRASRKFYAGPESGPGIVTSGLPATNRLLLEFGGSLGLGDLLQPGNRARDLMTNRVIRIDEANDFPTQWYGYESIDTVLLATSDPAAYRPLLQSQVRLVALTRWVELGGRLVIFSSTGAEELLSDGGALAPLVPGKFVKIEKLTKAQPLEIFSGSDQPITGNRRISLPVPQLTEVDGQILSSFRRASTEIPLVIKANRGLGEVIFIGLDFDRPPLRDWGGRTSFLRRILHWQDEDENLRTAEQENLEDVISHLRNSLEKQFVDVQVAPFGLVAFLVGIYILLIGPGDYLFVKRILKRTELTWITFPLIVLGVSAAAYGIANRMKGDQLRVNHVEIIDVDSRSGLTRGTAWTHFFTPQVSEYNLTFQPNYLGNTELKENTQLTSWLGLPGYTLGGMQASGSQTSVLDSGYQYGDQLASLQRLPVQVWSTKTITARWSAQVDVPIEFDLKQDGEELLQGSVTNSAEVELEDCILLFGRWAYDLGRLPSGKSRIIDDTLQPRTVRTLLTNATAGDKTVTQTADDGTISFQSTASWDVARLLKATMFYQTINGLQYTNKALRYQAFIDMSHILEQQQRAILLARCRAPGSQWLSDGQPLASDQDQRWTYYRFVLDVED